MQNFLTLPCYLLIFLSLFPALLHFVFFNFYYIITEHSYLRTLSFYFKIYYLIKHLQKSPISKTEQTSPACFFVLHQKPNIHSCHFRKPNIYSYRFRLFHENHITHKKQLIKMKSKKHIKKRPSHEASSLIFVFNFAVSLLVVRATLDPHVHINWREIIRYQIALHPLNIFCRFCWRTINQTLIILIAPLYIDI